MRDVLFYCCASEHRTLRTHTEVNAQACTPFWDNSIIITNNQARRLAMYLRFARVRACVLLAARGDIGTNNSIVLRRFVSSLNFKSQQLTKKTVKMSG